MARRLSSPSERLRRPRQRGAWRRTAMCVMLRAFALRTGDLPGRYPEPQLLTGSGNPAACCDYGWLISYGRPAGCGYVCFVCRVPNRDPRRRKPGALRSTAGGGARHGVTALPGMRQRRLRLCCPGYGMPLRLAAINNMQYPCLPAPMLLNSCYPTALPAYASAGRPERRALCLHVRQRWS